MAKRLKNKLCGFNLLVSYSQLYYIRALHRLKYTYFSTASRTKNKPKIVILHQI